MRRFPCSWNNTFTALGFKRKKSRQHPDKSHRLSRLEALEIRAMLSGDSVVDETASVGQSSVETAVAVQARPTYVLTIESPTDEEGKAALPAASPDGDDSEAPPLFLVETVNTESGPRAVLSLNPIYADNPPAALQKMRLELQLSGQTLEAYDILIDVAEAQFREKFLDERIEIAQRETADVNEEGVTAWRDASWMASEREQLKDFIGPLRLEQHQILSGDLPSLAGRADASQADYLTSLAKRHSHQEDVLRSGEDRSRFYDETTAAAQSIKASRLAADTEAKLAEVEQEEAALKNTTLLLARQLSADLACDDPQIALAAQALRDELVAAGDTYHTLFTGLGVDREVERTVTSRGDTRAFGFVETGSYTFSDQLTIELGDAQAMVQVTQRNLLRSFPLISASESPAVEDGSIDEASPATNGGAATSLNVNGTASATEEALIRFNLAEIAALDKATPTSGANLKLTEATTGAGSADVYVWNSVLPGDSGSASDWDETNLSHSHVDGTLDLDSKLSEFTQLGSWTAGTTTEIDVTDALRRALLYGDANGDGSFSAAGLRGDIEAFHLAVTDWDAYVAEYGPRATSPEDLLARTDGGLGDGVIDENDIADFFRRHGYSQGDFNLDGTVQDNADNTIDGLDWAIYQANFGLTGARFGQGDGNFDGVVDLDDFDIWNDRKGEDNLTPVEPEVVFWLRPEDSTTDLEFAAQEHTTLDGPTLEITEQPDIVLDRFTVDETGIIVDYNVLGTDFTGVEVEIYKAGDPDVLLHTVTGQAGTIGPHSVTIATSVLASITEGDSVYAKVIGTPSSGTQSNTDNDRLNFEFSTASTQVVSSTDDAGMDTLLASKHTLRELLVADKMLGWFDTITFDESLFADGGKRITLGDHDGDNIADRLGIEDDITIEGPGAHLLAISGNDQSRVMYVASGVVATLSGMAVERGNTTSTGGGILSYADLTLEEVVVRNNHSDDWGGGLTSTDGDLTIYASTFTGNTAQRGAGMYRNTTDHTTRIDSSTFYDNVATAVTSVHRGTGGGVYLAGGSSQDVDVLSSTFSGNEGVKGAGLIVYGTYPLDMVNTTVTENDAAPNGMASSGSVTTGGIHIQDTGHDVTLHNTIVAGNTSTNIYRTNFSGTVTTDSSYNLVEERVFGGGAGGLTDGVDGNIVLANGAYLGLTSLDSYGGLTKTHLVLNDSPAVDAGSDAIANSYSLDTDQRGFTRFYDVVGVNDTSGNLTDIGAYEDPPGVVDLLGDVPKSGRMTLRDAINDAQARDHDRVTFKDGLINGPHTLVLQDQPDADGDLRPDALLITKDLIVEGPGADLLTVTGSGEDKVIEVVGAQESTPIVVEISGLTVTQSAGSAISSENANLTLRGIRSTGNSGTGVYSDQGNLYLYDSEISDNISTYARGVIFSHGYNERHKLGIYNTTISGNFSSYQGGGVYVEAAFASPASPVETDISIINSTISNNTATEGAGLYFPDYGTASIRNEVEIYNSIIVGNPKLGAPSGTYEDVAGQFNMNTGTTGNNLVGVDGLSSPNFYYTDLGHSISSVGVAPLDFYGGTTRTHAILPSGTAIDGGNDLVALDSAGTPLDTDGRGTGYARKLGTSTDVGAFEGNAISSGTTLTLYGSEHNDTVQLTDGEFSASVLGSVPLEIPTGTTSVVVDLMGGDDVLSTTADFNIAIDASGGDGADQLTGGSAGDVLKGGAGADTIFAGAGADELRGGEGGDTLRGEAGDDSLYGEEGFDDLDDTVDQSTGVIDAGPDQTGPTSSLSNPSDVLAFFGTPTWQWEAGGTNVVPIRPGPGVDPGFDAGIYHQFPVISPPIAPTGSDTWWEVFLAGGHQMRMRLTNGTGGALPANVTYSLTEDNLHIDFPQNTGTTSDDYDLRFELHDVGSGTTTAMDFSVVVHSENEPNQAPTINVPGSLTTRKDQGVAFRVQAEDDFDSAGSLDYDLSTVSAPPEAGSSLLVSLSNEGVFRFHPASVVGTYEFQIDVEDSEGSQATSNVVVTAEDFNDSAPSGSSIEAEVLTYNLTPPTQITEVWNLAKFDSQTAVGDLTYSAEGLAPGMTLSAQGVLTWTYDSDQEAGVWNGVVKITDEAIGDSEARSSSYPLVSRIVHQHEETMSPHHFEYTGPGAARHDGFGMPINGSIPSFPDHVYTVEQADDRTYLAEPTFDLVDDPQHAQEGFALDPDTGVITYTPEQDGEGLDKFSYKISSSYEYRSYPHAEDGEYFAQTGNTAEVLLSVGEILRADIDVDLPEFNPDAKQEKSLWHVYDGTADAAQDALGAAYVGIGQRVPVRLGYWLREDAYSSDVTAYVSGSGESSIRLWDSAEGGSEIFATSVDQYGPRGGTHWLLDDLPGTVYVEGVSSGPAQLSLVVGDTSIGLYTDLTASSAGTSANETATDTVHFYVGPYYNVTQDPDEPDCQCECSCSNAPHGSASSDSGDVSVSVPVTGGSGSGAGLGGNFANPDKNEPVIELFFEGDGIGVNTAGTEANFDLHLQDPTDQSVSVAPHGPYFGPPNDFQGGIYGSISDHGPGSIPTGYYQYRLTEQGGTPSGYYHNNWLPVLKHGDYGFGEGWNVAGIERIVARPTNPLSDDIYWLRADNDILEFPTVYPLVDSNNNDVPVRAKGDPSATEITLVSGGGYLLTDKYQNKTRFDSAGYITEREDAYGNKTLYRYTTGHKIDEVETDLDGHITKFHWDATIDRVTKVEDFAGRVTLLHYDPSNTELLTSIELPDPDTVNPATEGGGPTSTFGYDADGNIEWFEDAEGTRTEYEYQASGQVITTKYAVGTGDEASTTLVIPEIPGWSTNVVNQAYERSESGSVDFAIPNRTGSFTDELGRVSTFKTNADGHVIEQVDSTDRTTLFERNFAGQPTKVQLYDAQGTLVDQTTYTYDDDFNPKGTTHYDVSSGTPVAIAVTAAAFDPYGRPLVSIDEIGRTVLIGYHDAAAYAPGAASQITTRVIVGQLDTSPVDDIVTETYFTTDGLVDYTVAKRIDHDGTPLDDIETHYHYTSGDKWLESVSTVVGGVTLAYVTSTYDSYGNPLTVSEAVEINGTAELDPNISDDTRRTTTYEYDRLDRVTKITAPDPGQGQQTPVTRLVYSQTGMVMERIESHDGLTAGDPAEIIMRYDYDGRHRIEKETYNYVAGQASTASQNVTTEYDYDDAGNLTAIIDPLLRETNVAYDMLNRPVRVIQPAPDPSSPNPVSYMAYDAVGRLLAERDANGNVTSYGYDARHRVNEVRAPLGATTRFGYDAASQLTTVIDAEGRTTGYAYDDAGRLSRLMLPGQEQTPLKYQYDTLGNLRIETDQLGRQMHYEYDTQSRLETEYDENGDATTYTYSDSGELLTLTDAEQNTTTWVHDGAGRVASETNESNDVREYLYDGFGNLAQYTDRNGRVTTYEYDRLHRQTAEKWYNDVAHLNALPGAPLRTFTTVYDEASQLTSVSEGGTTYAYDYDNLGRQTQVVQTLAGLTPQVTFDREFDARGRLTESAATIGGAADYVNTYSYDTLDRVTSIRQFGIPITGHAVNSKRVDFEYNDAGQFTAINRYASVDTSSPVVDTTFAYDSTARLTQIDHVGIVAHDYLYSDDNRLAVYNNSIDGAVHYYYDANGQLTQANYLGDWQSDETYNYDDNANRTSGIVNFEGTAAYTTGDDNRLTGDGTYAYVYDAEGNRTQRILDLDDDGAWDSSEAATLYTWDHRNRLTKVQEFSPNYTVEKEVEFSYDPLDRLIHRAVDTDGDGTIDEQTFYAWELGQKVLEFEKQGTGNAVASDLSERYLWGAAVDQALAAEQVDSLADASQNETLWTLTDNLGSVKDVVDSNGNHRIHRQFDSFGNTVSETHYDAGSNVVTVGQPGYVTIDLGYTGKMLEVYTGLQYHNARWLDLRTGSWISKDFIWDGTNRYAYVGNQPTTYKDVDGLKGYWAGVGDVFKGYGDAVVGTAKGVGFMIRHPIQTVKGVGTAIRHPIRTGKAICEDIGDKSGSLRGQGELAGDIIIGVATGGAVKAASKSATVVKITSKLDNVIPDSKLVTRILAKMDLYPRVIDPRTGRNINFPAGITGRVPKADRVPWGSSQRGQFIKEWCDRGYETPLGGWDKYDIHHIHPREFGGTNDFINLVPVERNTHKLFNAFWREFKEL